MREVLKAITTTLHRNIGRGTRLIDEPNRKKVMDTTIGNPQGSILISLYQRKMNLQRLYGAVSDGIDNSK